MLRLAVVEIDRHFRYSYCLRPNNGGGKYVNDFHKTLNFNIAIWSRAGLGQSPSTAYFSKLSYNIGPSAL